ncbi:MAG: TIGR02450 family Trp-rich protein [Methylococcales bacterium]|nr:TIGR02450 family Trp-rich protein [Methylococcales bacterium]
MKPPTHNPINPEKLLLSKWTAVVVQNKRKHFLVNRLIRDEQQKIVGCVLEAVIDHHEIEMPWQALKDPASWLSGWR